ncbi:hypothetical protein N9E25_08770 [Verrucomicrobiales bacterium]|nr:hypothetical protein [Verrucomicrobiales bacterium]
MISAAAICVGFAINYFTDGEGLIISLINIFAFFAGLGLIASFFAILHFWGSMYFSEPIAFKRSWRKAAEQGYARAQGVLGQCYKEGPGVKQDDVLAYMWFDIAMPRYAGAHKASMWRDLAMPRYAGAHKASMWRDLAMPRYEGALSNKASLDRTMTPEQIAEAQKLSREWKPKGQ